MSRKELTPAELTFQSFRHSQGNMGVQLGIFRYFDLKYGIKADLHPTGDDFKKYVGYISGKSHRSHLQFQDDTLPSAEKAVYVSFKSLRSYRNDKAYKFYSTIGLTSTISTMVVNLYDQETRILNTDQPWTRYDNSKDSGQNERLQARIASGKSSFLYYYGRDGHSTGIEGFDEMYRALWNRCSFFDERRIYADRSTKHGLAVLDVERSYLGKVMLAQPPK